MRQTETYDQETKGIENRQLCLSIIQQQESLTKINQVGGWVSPLRPPSAPAACRMLGGRNVCLS